MEIITQKNIGFCGGVDRAVNLAREAAAKSGTVYTLGELIHNKNAIEKLKNEGIIPVNDPDEMPAGATVIIRTHGVGKEVYSRLNDMGVRIVDATCAFVRQIQKKAEQTTKEGGFVILLGNAEHPEIRGIRGWCGPSAVIGSEEEADAFEFPSGYDRFTVAAQTTLTAERYSILKEKLQDKGTKHNKTVEFFNSICYTTVVKQDEAKNIALTSDAVLVIGDRGSSNTKNLFSISQNYCKNTYYISDVSDIKSVADIKNIAKLGILAGASTPEELVMEVINIMNQNIVTDNAVSDEVAINKTEESVQETNETTATEAAPEAVAQEETTAVAAPEEDNPVTTETAAPAPKKAKEQMTMEMALKRYAQPRTYREGLKLKATIVSVDPTGVTVSVEGMGKNDTGFVEKDQMELDGSYNPESYQVGSQIDVVIVPKTDAKQKALNLSKKAYDELKIQDEAVKKILEGEEFSLACDQAIKGGLLGKIGTYTIFVPASQIRVGYVKNLEDYVGKKLRLRVLPPKEEVEEDGSKRKPNPKRIVASQRVILEEEKSAREEAFWEVMEVNNIIKGKVKRFTPFGAFVSIMNHDCLAHISDLSWTKIKDPSEVLELNKSYDFVVIKVDRENDKVSLGYKQLQKKPYELAAEKYHVGDVIKGKVERIKDFGAFVEIEPGIDGLVHVSEIGHKWIANANEVLNVGDEIEAKIIGFENNKITLSIKALTEAPVVEAEETGDEEKPQRPSKFKKFENAEKGERKERKPRRDKNEESDEPREWVSSSKSGATFADLFKDFDINKFDEDQSGDAE